MSAAPVGAKQAEPFAGRPERKTDLLLVQDLLQGGPVDFVRVDDTSAADEREQEIGPAIDGGFGGQHQDFVAAAQVQAVGHSVELLDNGGVRRGGYPEVFAGIDTDREYGVIGAGRMGKAGWLGIDLFELLEA